MRLKIQIVEEMLDFFEVGSRASASERDVWGPPAHAVVPKLSTRFNTSLVASIYSTI